MPGLLTSLGHRHCDKPITRVISFNPHNHQERYIPLSPFHRRRYRCYRIVVNLTKVTCYYTTEKVLKSSFVKTPKPGYSPQWSSAMEKLYLLDVKIFHHYFDLSLISFIVLIRICTVTAKVIILSSSSMLYFLELPFWMEPNASPVYSKQLPSRTI